MSAVRIELSAPVLVGRSARSLAAGIARGDFSAREVVDAHIARVQEVEPRLNALVSPRFAQARAEADEVDRKRARREPLGPLAGVPVTVKDCLDVEGLPSTGGLPSRKGHRAAADERHVARWREAGAVVLGKTNVAQILLFLETDNPAFGLTRHPENPDRSPGGSSGGEAASIAAGGSALGLGTDIGGSVRFPAASCGLVGLKPTAGRMPDDGRLSVPIGQTAIPSQVGVIGRSVADVALGLTAANGPDGRPLADPVDLKKTTVGVLETDGFLAPSPAIRRALREAGEALARAGCTVVPWDPPDPSEALRLVLSFFSADGGAGLRRLLGSDPVHPRIAEILQIAGAPPWAIPLMRVFVRLSGRRKLADLAASYGHTRVDDLWQAVERLQAFQQRMRQSADALGRGEVVLLSPVAAVPSYRHGDGKELIIGGSYTALYNALGWPAGVVPVTRVRAEEAVASRGAGDVMDRTADANDATSAGLPVGVQIAARPWRESAALAAMSAVEENAGFARARGDASAEAG